MLRRCGRCGQTYRDRAHRYCRPCFAAYMREWRKTHPLTGEQRDRARARWKANTYLRRGKIERGPCVTCGKPGEEMHHPDYTRPLDVVWYCRPCHLAHHERERVRAILAEAA